MLPTAALDAWVAGTDVQAAETDLTPTSSTAFSWRGHAWDAVAVNDANITQLRATSIARRPIATLKRSKPVTPSRLGIQNWIIDVSMLRPAANEAPAIPTEDLSRLLIFPL
jgi:hypothetical protein